MRAPASFFLLFVVSVVSGSAQIITRPGGGGGGSSAPSTVYCPDVGTTNVMSCTGSPTITSYTTGLTISLVPATTNGAATTLAVNGLAAKNVYLNGAPLTAAKLVQGQAYTLFYDGTRFNVVTAISALYQQIQTGNSPQGIAFDASKNIWISNVQTDSIQVFSQAGALLHTISLPAHSGAEWLVFDSVNGYVDVLESFINQVQSFDATTYALKWTADGTQGVTSNPSAIWYINGHIWGSNTLANSAFTLDATTGAEIGTAVTVGNFPYFFAADASNTNLFVSNQSDGTVSKINEVTRTVTATYTCAVGNEAIAADLADGFLACGAFGYPGAINTLNVIKMSDGTTPYAAVTVPTGFGIFGIAYDGYFFNLASSNGNTIIQVVAKTGVVANILNPVAPESFTMAYQNPSLIMTSLATNSFIAVPDFPTVAAGTTALAVCDDAHGHEFVMNWDDGTATEINASTRAVIRTVTLGSGPAGCGCDPNGTYCFAANENDGTATRITVASGAVSTSGMLCGGPVGVVTDNTSAYLTCSFDNTVVKITEATLLPDGAFGTAGVAATGFFPLGITRDASGNLFIAADADGTVWKQSATDGSEIGSPITVGSSPISLADATVAGVDTILCANQSSNTVTEITASTGAVLATFPSGGYGPSAIAWSGTQIGVANLYSNTVTILDPAGPVISVNPTGFGVQGLAYSSSAGHFWTANAFSNTANQI